MKAMTYPDVAALVAENLRLSTQLNRQAITTAALKVDRDQSKAKLFEESMMSECMRQFRADMIEAGVVGESCPPMMMTEGVSGYIGKLKAECEQFKSEIAKVKAAISDPNTVFTNMKAGKIAKPTLRNMVDLYGDVLNGDEAQLLEIARLRAECEGLRVDAGRYAHMKSQQATGSALLERLDMNIRPENWDAAVDADMRTVTS